MQTYVSFRDTEIRDMEIVFNIDERGCQIMRFQDVGKKDYVALIKAIPGNENLTAHYLNQYSRIEDIENLVDYYCGQYGLDISYKKDVHFTYLKNFLYQRQKSA